MSELNQLYKTWETLNHSRSELHKSLTQSGLWGVEHARKAYLDLSEASEDAWLHYVSGQRGISFEQALWEMNQSYSSRFD